MNYLRIILIVILFMGRDHLIFEAQFFAMPYSVYNFILLKQFLCTSDEANSTDDLSSLEDDYDITNAEDQEDEAQDELQLGGVLEESKLFHGLRNASHRKYVIVISNTVTIQMINTVHNFEQFITGMFLKI